MGCRASGARQRSGADGRSTPPPPSEPWSTWPRSCSPSTGTPAPLLDAIVTGARVTKGALYHHFVGKQALFEAVFERVEGAASKAIYDRISGQDDPWLKARAGLRGVPRSGARPDLPPGRHPGRPCRARVRAVPRAGGALDLANVLTIVGRVLTTGRLAMDEAMQRTFARIFFGAMSSAGESVSLAEDPRPPPTASKLAIETILSGLRSLAEAGVPRVESLFFSQVTLPGAPGTSSTQTWPAGTARACP